MTKVETKVFVVYETSLLRHMCSQHFAQCCVQEMCSAVVQHNVFPSFAIYRCNDIAVKIIRDGFGKMNDEVVFFPGIRNIKTNSTTGRRKRKHSGVTNLSATFCIERSGI